MSCSETSKFYIPHLIFQRMKPPNPFHNFISSTQNKKAAGKKMNRRLWYLSEGSAPIPVQGRWNIPSIQGNVTSIWPLYFKFSLNNDKLLWKICGGDGFLHQLQALAGSLSKIWCEILKLKFTSGLDRLSLGSCQTVFRLDYWKKSRIHSMV